MENPYIERVDRAEQYFLQGFNCAQSVMAAFADLYGLTEKQGLKIAASFGGGMGRMRLTCGAFSGISILLGLETGSIDPADKDGKGYNYSQVQHLAQCFKKANGSLTCAELLGLVAKEAQVPMPSDRTPVYYKGRPCAKLVRSAANIYSEYLFSKTQDEKM